MYLNTSARAWLFCTFLCIQTALSFGQSKNFYLNRAEPSWIVKLSPKAYKVKTKDVSDGYYLGLVEEQNHAELKEQYRHYVREIVSQSGVQNASEISVTYDPGFQKLTFHKIIVWRNNHPIDKLKASKFKVLQNEKERSKFIYSGTFDAYLILDDVRKGDRIEYAYTIKGDNPIYGDKYTNTFYFEGSSSYGREYTNLIVSNRRKLNFKNFNFDKKPGSRNLAGMRIYEWESSNTKTHRSPAYEPSWYVAEKYTQVTEYESWNDVVNWGLKVNSYPNLQTPLLDKTVSELQSLAGANQEKYIELATRFVQDEIRYMGIEMGEYSQRPNSPERVLTQRYGDCKDKSLLLTYLLNKQHINAYMAYVDTYSGKRSREFLPSPFLFNHAVVVVEYNHIKTWIDPTISNQRGTFKSIWFPNYGQALVLKPGVDKPEDVISIATGKLVANLQFKLPDTAAGKKASLVIKSTYTDNYADDIRGTIEDQGTDGLEKSFREYISKYYPDVENKANIIIKDDEGSNTINITESYLIDNIWLKQEKVNANRYIYFFGDLIDNELRIIKDKNRKEPISLKYPVNVEENISVQLPAAWRYPKQSTKVESNNYYFEFNSFSRGNTYNINYSYRNFKDHVEPADISQYIKDTKKINENLSTYIYYGGSWENGDYNPYLILLGILTIMVSAFAFLRKYQLRTQYDIKQILRAPAIGGWLILVAVSVVLDPIGLLITAGKGGIFSLIPDSRYGATTQVLLQFAQIVKVLFFAIKLNWAILIMFLFFKRRENLPQQYIRYMYFLVVTIVFIFAIEVVVNSVTHQRLITMQYTFTNLAAIAICVIWAEYFKRSSRVKNTFVFTYPELPWRTDRIKYTNALIAARVARERETTEL